MEIFLISDVKALRLHLRGVGHSTSTQLLDSYWPSHDELCTPYTSCFSQSACTIVIYLSHCAACQWLENIARSMSHHHGGGVEFGEPLDATAQVVEPRCATSETKDSGVGAESRDVDRCETAEAARRSSSTQKQ